MNIGLLGFGVVGRGVYDMLAGRDDIRAAWVLCRRDLGELTARTTYEMQDILDDPAVDIVVEVMGGLHPAYEYVAAALRAGKNVVSSNKYLMCRYYDELTALAKKHGAALRCTAAVGGGIPWLTNLEKAARANHISRVWGILNGTTNYILTRMIRAGLPFADALCEAQAKGYAEANPSADIDGLDACRKVCILSSIAYGDHVYPEYVETEGISKITLNDVAYADKADCVVKLLGRTVLNDDGSIYAFVAPHFVSKSSPLASVEDVFNAIMITGDMLGDAMFYGQGAGKLATASAVVADMIDCARHNEKRRNIGWGDGSKKLVRPLDTFESGWYVRLKGKDAAEKLKAAFPDCTLLPSEIGEVACLTGKVSTKDMRAAREQLQNVAGCMRVL